LDPSGLLAALGYAVFERTNSGSWESAEPLLEAFPFLESFLPDAECFWANPGGASMLRSDFWTQTDSNGAERHFRAIALAGDRRYLLIQDADQSYQQTQALVQYAHESKLAEREIARLNHELERATEAKSEFLARMSHEIRTPMNSLLGIGELLSETQLNPEQSEYVRIFRRAGDNLLSVINDILDFSKVEAGQIVLESIAFELPVVVDEAIEIIGLKGRAKGLVLRTEIQQQVPARLVGDPGRLRQILLNLLGNALKFTERGEIVVRVEVEQGEPPALHFSVSDTGVGIPAEHVGTIFDRFTQTDASTTRKYGGTGLGLAISKRFVELMGGRIWAESAPGTGTTIHFTARFTVAEPHAGIAAGEESRGPAGLADRRLRILLADDSEDNRFLVRGYLRDTGCVIDEADNGADALEKFKHSIYDVILMDTEMPRLDGYSATRAMRAFENERGMQPAPILALTAHAFKEAKDRSLEAGCTDHLTKPISKSGLLGAIARHAPALPANPIHVAVESWLKPVVPAYLEKRRADVGKLRAALGQEDFAGVRTIGHQMSGSGAGYGFPEISEIGAVIEEAALAQDGARIENCIKSLEQYLRNVVAD
jgi:signal transduction histidine kinase/CheY-like chemotaxis protein/HPt (histidine-containing phosphotransfer) domain-containing protein